MLITHPEVDRSLQLGDLPRSLRPPRRSGHDRDNEDSVERAKELPRSGFVAAQPGRGGSSRGGFLRSDEAPLERDPSRIPPRRGCGSARLAEAAGEAARRGEGEVGGERVEGDARRRRGSRARAKP